VTPREGDSNRPDQALIDTLRRAGLVDSPDTCRFERLVGGVSSDIWQVVAPDRVFCVKRALPKLKVAADWRAPVERNRYEVAWFEVVHGIVPGAVPRILFHDADAMLCAMSYLDPDSHRLWKDELREGRADPAAAGQVGSRLGRIHAATAGDRTLERRFPRSDIFRAIRLEPYLEATAERHPDLKDRLHALSRRTDATRLALIHGDVSPKNILLGPDGPVFLDAECACIGEPAFDIAFCLNHLLLKCLWNPPARAGYFACFESLTAHYLGRVDWEPVAALEARAASLLPGLFLARVDGKSPVEYLSDEADRNRVRRCARRLLAAPPRRLSDVLSSWQTDLAS
jgi:aminoglycoside phosphotransferase (APT) family kinase protein